MTSYSPATVLRPVCLFPKNGAYTRALVTMSAGPCYETLCQAVTGKDSVYTDGSQSVLQRTT